MIYQVTTPYFCAGIVVEKKIIVEAAPIMNWAVGQKFSEVKKWIKSKNGKIEEVQE